MGRISSLLHTLSRSSKCPRLDVSIKHLAYVAHLRDTGTVHFIPYVLFLQPWLIMGDLRCQRSGCALPAKRRVVCLITLLGLSRGRPIVRPRLHITPAYGTKQRPKGIFNTFLVFIVLICVKNISIGFSLLNTKSYLPESDLKQHNKLRSNHAFANGTPTSPHPFYDPQFTIGVELRVFQITKVF